MNKLNFKLMAGSLLLLASILPVKANASDSALVGLHLVERVDHRVYRGYGNHYRAPRWIRRDHEFMHWYDNSHYRHRHSIDWYRLFEIYLHEVEHRRYRKYDRRHRYDYDHRHRYKSRHRDRHRWRH